jgi:hypothetical protein
MMPTNLDQIYLILAFVVPGFIFHSAYSFFIRSQSQRADLDLLRFIATSFIIFALLSPYIYWLSLPENADLSYEEKLLNWFIILFVLPFVFGVGWAIVTKRAWFRKFFNVLGLNPIHYSPTAWDWQFGRMEYPHWVIVTLNDDSVVGGLFGTTSLAGSHPDSRDIYIEEVYSIDDQGKWERAADTAGILITKDNIKHIEFKELHPQEETKDD